MLKGQNSYINNTTESSSAFVLAARQAIRSSPAPIHGEAWRQTRKALCNCQQKYRGLRPVMVCVCVNHIILIRLHPARMGYGSCWSFPAFISSPVLSPNAHFLAEARSCQHPNLLLPIVPWGGEKAKKKEEDNSTKPSKPPRCILEMALLRPLPYKCPVGSPGPINPFWLCSKTP